MSFKYSLNDALIGSGALDYAAIEPDTEWIPSERHMKAIEKALKRADRGRVSFVPGLIAAAALLAVASLAFIRPVREAVSSLFTAHPDTTSEITQAPSHEETTGAKTTEPDQTDPDTTAVIGDQFSIFEETVRSIAEDGYTAEKWNTLTSLGEFSFINSCSEYFSGEHTAAEKTVYGVYCSYVLSDELGNDWNKFTGSMEKAEIKDLYFIESYDGTWLSELSGKLYSYCSDHISMPDLALRYPHVFNVLGASGKADYEYPPYKAREHTFSENIDRLIERGDQSVMRYLLSYDAYKYCLDEYFTEKDVKRRAAISVICAEYIRNDCDDGKTQRSTFPLKLLLGNDGYRTLFGAGGVRFDSGRIRENSALWSDWLDDFAALLESKAKDLPENLFRTDLEELGFILDRTGFKGYRDPTDEETMLADVIGEALSLYNAVENGRIVIDENAEYDRFYYSFDSSYMPEGTKPLTDEMISHIERARIMGLSERDCVELVGFADELRTVEGWVNKYSRVLPKETVERTLRDTYRFFIIDGRVYIDIFTTAGPENWYVYPGTLRIKEKNDGKYTAEAIVARRYESYSRESFVLSEDEDGTLRLVGGTCFEKCFSCGSITMAHAADSVYEILRAHSALYNGDVSEYESVAETGSTYLFSVFAAGEITGSSVMRYLGEVTAPLPAYIGIYCGERPLGKYVDEETLGIMLSDGGPVTHVGYSIEGDYSVDKRVILISPAGAKARTVPVIGAAGSIDATDVRGALRELSSSDTSITVALDFVREENGEKRNETYTFELTLAGETARLTGGTFYDLLRSDK